MLTIIHLVGFGILIVPVYLNIHNERNLIHYCVKVRKLAEIVNSGIQPLQNLSLLQHIEKMTGQAEQRAEWGHYWVNKGLLGVPGSLFHTPRKYLVTLNAKKKIQY